MPYLFAILVCIFATIKACEIQSVDSVVLSGLFGWLNLSRKSEELMKRSLGFSLATAITLAGCADKSSEISSTYVSPMQYQNYSCQQLSQEAQRISARAAQTAGVQDSQASSDAVATGVAVVLFWPAAFFIGGNKENRAELARLKGELEAIEKVSIQKQCDIQFRKS
ncbi:MAG TPA: hypothetical protein VJ906_08430 [Roseovarius sp.]|nr:hypothetical protein [Roseovarius sp.]